MQQHFNNEGGTFPSLSISINIAWLAHSSTPWRTNVLFSWNKWGWEQRAGYGPGLATLLQDAAVLEVVYRPDVACCRSPYLWLKATFWIFRLLNCGVRGCAWCLVSGPGLETRHCPRTQRWGLEFLFDIDTVTNTQYLEKTMKDLWSFLYLMVV